jgi:hypothetical protein
MKLLYLCQTLMLLGCSREPETPIIQRVVKDGAGNVRAASTEAIQQWMQTKGAPYAQEIWKMCEPVQRAAAATWGDSTEGRICKAANGVRFFGRGNVGSDPRRY